VATRVSSISVDRAVVRGRAWISLAFPRRSPRDAPYDYQMIAGVWTCSTFSFTTYGSLLAMPQFRCPPPANSIRDRSRPIVLPLRPVLPATAKDAKLPFMPNPASDSPRPLPATRSLLRSGGNPSVSGRMTGTLAVAGYSGFMEASGVNQHREGWPWARSPWRGLAIIERYRGAFPSFP
jgi:hypothetical protein